MLLLDVQSFELVLQLEVELLEQVFGRKQLLYLALELCLEYTVPLEKIFMFDDFIHGSSH